ncbi:MAG: uroporphyrinogen-III synthase [Paracoccaceae bacterium]|nr:uroporphyrinogen-III synthase [Paracoccaceae bacterium]
MTPTDITLLLTRPRPAALRFAAELEAATGPFAATVISPLLDIVPSGPFPRVSAEAALAFTSENAVAIAASRLAPAGRRAWCVGTRTAEAARAAGFDAVVAGGDADALVALLLAERPMGEIVHLAGGHQRGDLAERLAAGGLTARRAVIYDQAPVPPTAEALAALGGPRPVLLPLFSPRSAALAAAMAEGAAAPLLLAALSPAVARGWGGPAPMALVTASRPESEALIDAISSLLAAAPGA